VTSTSGFVGEGSGLLRVSSVAIDSVYTDSIRSQNITFAKISANGCAANEIMKRNAANTAWICAPDVGGGVTLAPSIADIETPAREFRSFCH